MSPDECADILNQIANRATIAVYLLKSGPVELRPRTYTLIEDLIEDAQKLEEFCSAE